MVIGSIFSEEFLRRVAGGELAEIPLPTIMPLLAMENLQLRSRIDNLLATLRERDDIERQIADGGFNQRIENH